MTTPFAIADRPCRGRAPLVLPFLLIPITFLSGCRTNNTELLEAELRNKERIIAEMNDNLARKDCEVQGLEAELEQAQRLTFKPGEPVPAGIIVKNITLGRATGGYDKDPNCPGDEELQVLLEPRDCDNQSVKAPGSVHIEVYEITSAGLKIALSSWELTPRELRRTWDNPILGGPAYRITLPWKALPTTEKLRVVARFTTPDGQKFEADKDVSIRLPEGQRKSTSIKKSTPPLGPHVPADEPLHAPAPTPKQEPPPLLAPPPPPVDGVQTSGYTPEAARRERRGETRSNPADSSGVGLGSPAQSNWKPISRQQ